MKIEVIELGLIKGRHSLPVENYIVEEGLDVFTKKELKPIIEEGLKKCGILEYHYFGYECYSTWMIGEKEYGKPPVIRLFITGLTIVTLTTVDILNNWGYEVEIMGYNPNTKEYYSQGEFDNLYNWNF